MRVQVKCYATLADKAPADNALDLADGATVGDVVAQLGIDTKDIALMFVNGVHRKLDTPLREGDALGLFPPVGGG